MVILLMIAMKFMIDKIFSFRRHLFNKRCEVCCSSRTDARVHALQSTFHVDVKNDEKVSYTDSTKHEMIALLNSNLKGVKAAIRIQDVNIVNETNFSAFRNALDRSYLYRIAVKPKQIHDEHEHFIPIEEVDRCFIIEYAESRRVECIKSKMYFFNFQK